MTGLTAAALAVTLSLAPGAPAAEAAGVAGPRASLSDEAYRFGRAVSGTVLEREFLIRNLGSAPLRVARVHLTPPLSVTRLPALVPPGGAAPLGLRLETATLDGPFEGRAVIEVDDPDRPELRVAFEGTVVPTVEVAPAPAVFLSTIRGAPRETSLEIVSHEEQPVRVRLPREPSSERFTARLEPLEQGRRYRLVVSIRPDGPPGKHASLLELETSSALVPTIRVSVHTYVRERVYTFPDAIDLGAVRLADLRDPRFAERIAQTLMVYQVGGTDFLATLRTDLPCLRLQSERGPKGDRYQATVAVAPERAVPGPITGSVVVETNDREFPRVVVPVTGRVLE